MTVNLRILANIPDSMICPWTPHSSHSISIFIVMVLFISCRRRQHPVKGIKATLHGPLTTVAVDDVIVVAQSQVEEMNESTVVVVRSVH